MVHLLVLSVVARYYVEPLYRIGLAFVLSIVSSFVLYSAIERPIEIIRRKLRSGQADFSPTKSFWLS